MRLLIDTNVVISSEPGDDRDVEHVSPECLRLSAAAARGGHTLLVHPTVVEEIARDHDVDRRNMRELLLGRYNELTSPPAPQAALRDAYPTLVSGSHDWYDHLLLACVLGDAVHGLVTQDEKIRRKARRLGLSDRVHTVTDALAMLDGLDASSPPFVPSVDVRPLYSLDLADPFFDSLRADYDFDEWFRRKAREGRTAHVIDGPDGQIAGLCIIKGLDDEIDIGGRPVKVSTFKVAEAFKGNRYGELLLKVLFAETSGSGDAVWLTVYEKQAELIALLEAFGFRRHDVDRNGETRYLKRFRPRGEEPPTGALEHHVLYGPPALRPSPEQTFITPIKPRFHWSLFPDAPGEQLGLIAPPPHGNALRKAYLCHANVRSVEPGATMLFYRSEDVHGVSAIGVLEQSLVSDDADEIMAFVGSRTVYSADQVREMANAGTVLAFLFRQDRFLEPPIRLRELVDAHAVLRAPQTTISIRPEGFQWLADRLGA